MFFPNINKDYEFIEIKVLSVSIFISLYLFFFKEVSQKTGSHEGLVRGRFCLSLSETATIATSG